MIRMIGVLGVLSLMGFTTPPGLVIQPDSRIWVEGKSTVRDFKCTAGVVEGRVEAGATPLSLPTIQTAVASVDLAIPVDKLACGNGTMDEHMKKALKASEHGTIEFRLTGYTAAPPAADTSELELRGVLRIAGVDQPVTVRADATQEADGTLRVQGSQTIAMTKWGVKPPSLMLGTMKVKDEVVIHFDIRLRQQ